MITTATVQIVLQWKVISFFQNPIPTTRAGTQESSSRQPQRKNHLYRRTRGIECEVYELLERSYKRLVPHEDYRLSYAR